PISYLTRQLVRGKVYAVDGGGSQQNCAQIVNRVVTSLTRGGEGHGDHAQSNHANGQIDVEDPAPGEGIDKKTAKQGPGDAGETIHRAKYALVAPTLARRYDIANKW